MSDHGAMLARIVTFNVTDHQKDTLNDNDPR